LNFQNFLESLLYVQGISLYLTGNCPAIATHSQGWHGGTPFLPLPRQAGSSWGHYGPCDSTLLRWQVLLGCKSFFSIHGVGDRQDPAMSREGPVGHSLLSATLPPLDRHPDRQSITGPNYLGVVGWKRRSYFASDRYGRVLDTGCVEAGSCQVWGVGSFIYLSVSTPAPAVAIGRSGQESLVWRAHHEARPLFYLRSLPPRCTTYGPGQYPVSRRSHART